MCYWQDDNDYDPPAEAPSISRARLALIAELGRLSAISPGDNWIAGEHIRYMIAAGQDSAAVSAALACTPSRWYCDVLRGYALHSSGRYADASAAFDAALARMPNGERCRWNDISMLLDDAGRSRYGSMPCGTRDSVEYRFWNLARPSLAVDGNDRRTEHFSRVLLANLAEDAANAYGMTWGDDMRELLIRYGAPAWYSTAAPEPYRQPPVPMGHGKEPSFHFAAAIDGDSVRWDTHSPAARGRYAPPYIDTLTSLAVQFAMMKRGDSAVVAAVYSDTTPGEELFGTAAGARDTTRQPPGNPRIRRMHVEWKGVMVSMEKFDRARRRDARARAWIAPPPHVAGAPELSTLLLFAADSGVAVATFDDALVHALPGDDLSGTRKLGLYWEVYSKTSHDSAAMTVTVTRTDGSALRRLGLALHITRRDSPLAVRWYDAMPAAGIAPHSVVLDLTQLPAGTYRVTVAADVDAAHRTEVSRNVQLK